MQGPVTSSSAQSQQLTEIRRPSSAVNRGLASTSSPARSVSQAGAPPAAAFASVFRAAHQSSPVQSYDIQQGDTLSAIAHRRLQELGLPSTGADVNRAVGQIAAANAISNPDRIFAGDRIDLSVLESRTQVRPGEWPSKLVSAAVARPAAVGAAQTHVAARPAAVRPVAAAVGQSVFPQLQKTLDRAVERGYVEPHDRQAVQDRIVDLSRKFKFSPDDFATVALMESDGLNPRATNGRCHGILQFCEGPGRGAASVGMEGRAAEIQRQPVLAQLDLVERYFDDNRLGEKGPVSLVDLYLTVLTPAARAEQRPHAALEIAGRQAKALYVSGDRSQPITRQSILSGLISHAQQRLEALIHSRRDSDQQAPKAARTAPGPVSALIDGQGGRTDRNDATAQPPSGGATGRQG